MQGFSMPRRRQFMVNPSACSSASNCVSDRCARAAFSNASSVNIDVATIRQGTITTGGGGGDSKGDVELSDAGTNTVRATTWHVGDSPAAGNTDHAYIPGIHASPHAARVSGMEKPEFDFSTSSLRTPGNCSMHYSTSCIPAVVPEGEGIDLLTFGSVFILNIFSIHSDPPPKGGGFTDPLSGTLK